MSRLSTTIVRNSSTVAKTMPMATNVTKVFTAAPPREVELSRRVCGLWHGRSDGQQLDGPIQEQSAGDTVMASGDLRADGFNIPTSSRVQATVVGRAYQCRV